MSCNHLGKYLVNERSVNNSIYPCVFIEKLKIEFMIIVVYVDDLNLVKIHKNNNLIEKRM